MTNILPLQEHNAIQNEGVAGGAFPILTKKSDHTRSSVRDFLVDTRTKTASTSRLTIKTTTMATKILTCDSTTGVKAYGVQAASGANLLPVARMFKGKSASLTVTTYTAKYEVIVSAGVYQTPHLLKVCIPDTRTLNMELRVVVLSSFLVLVLRQSLRSMVSRSAPMCPALVSIS